MSGRRKMKLIGYGEDALTLWALTRRIEEILSHLGDNTPHDLCTVFFRPSFGCRGGPASSEFGEFDFILLTKEGIYLGESKWYHSPEDIVNGQILLRREQLERHQIMTWYIREWMAGGFKDWMDFLSKKGGKISQTIPAKPLPPQESLLSQNLTTFLNSVRKHFGSACPPIHNVLLYFHRSEKTKALPNLADGDFTVVNIDYSEDRIGNFVDLSISKK